MNKRKINAPLEISFIKTSIINNNNFYFNYSNNKVISHEDLIDVFFRSHLSRKLIMSSSVQKLKKITLFSTYQVLCHILKLFSHLIALMFSSKESNLPPIDDHNLITPALKLSQQIKSGHITSEEVVESFITRIKRINPIINAVVDKRFQQALKEAREIDRKLNDARDGNGDISILKLTLVGIPLSVKETIAIDGYSFTGGLMGRKFVKAPKYAQAVDLLMKAGLIPIALTNIPEMTMWWDSSNPLYGTTNNPYDLSRIPGGSSGGEAALITSAGSVVGIGSDLAGSIRIPANFCGIFGHKPTPFVVSTEGMYPTVKGDREKLLGVGPMTRYACDLIPMLKIMAGNKVERLRLDEPVDLKKLKVYFVDDLGDPLAAKCSTEILEVFYKAVDHFVETYKVQAKRVVFEEFRYGFLLWSAEANSDPIFQDGIEDELNPMIEIVKKMFYCSEHNMSSIMAATLDKFSPSSGSRGNKVLIQKAAELRQKFQEQIGDDGILLVPSHPEAAPKHYTTLLKVLNVSYTSVTTVLQAPITQCPLGLTKEGLPFGLQIIAKPFNDRLTIAVAQELEKAFHGWRAPCRIDV